MREWMGGWIDRGRTDEWTQIFQTLVQNIKSSPSTPGRHVGGGGAEV
jgi:hypothetical protein